MEKKKHIWIVNYYTAPPKYIANPRHLEFAHFLQEAGYKVTIFSTGYLRVQDIDLVDNGRPYKDVTYGDLHFIHIKVRHYKGNGLDRILSIWEFARKILKYRRQFETPDLIYQNIHAPFDAAVSLCAKKMHVRYIAEAWDLWPSSFVTFGLISKRNPLMWWAYSQEYKMYKRASDIVYTFEGGKYYLKKQHWTNLTGGKIDENCIHYINNGVNLEKFDIDKKTYLLHDPDVEDKNLFKIVYLGSIRMANDIKLLIDAVSLLRKYKDIRLLIYGNGNQRESLIQYCLDKGIDNVVFKNEWIPLKYVPYVMSNSDLNILNYEKRFGSNGVSSGKLFLSLASGKPIVCNVNIAYDDVISDNNLGHAGWLNSSKEYADEILKIYNMSREDYTEMCYRVRNSANKFDYKNLSKQLLSIIEK